MSRRRNFLVGDQQQVEVGGDGLFLIAGPCVVESRDSALRHAAAVSEICRRTGVGVIFKSSFDKANRTSGSSFRGPGADEGLRILAEVRKESGLPILTDVHETSQVTAASEVADVLQIPALLSRQTDLIAAAAASGKAVNIKKGQFSAPWDMEHVVAKAESAGGERIILTERGTSFGYGNLVNDFRSLEIMKELRVPVVFDATHSVQLPSAGDGVSAGERRYAAPLARAAVAVGVDGVFMEVHEDPDSALSDGPNSIKLDDLQSMLDSLRAIDDAARASR